MFSAHRLMASLAQGCSFTCWIVSLFLGSLHRSFVIRSLASSETFFHRSSGLKANLPLTTCLSSWSTSLARKGIVFEIIT